MAEPVNIRSGRPPASPADPPWLAVARREVGVRETAGPSSTDRIVEYIATTHLGGKPEDGATAWCAAFVGWCLIEAGYKSTRRANARSYLNYGMALHLTDPRLGCIAVLSRGANKNLGHVGFWGGWLDKKQSQLWLLGGNQGNRVSWSLYDTDRVIAFRMPRPIDKAVRASDPPKS